MASPPFTVRNSTLANQELGNDALPHQFVQVPIYSYLQYPKNKTTEVIVDDIDLYGCDYVRIVDERFPMDSTYTSVWWLMDDLRSPMQ